MEDPAIFDDYEREKAAAERFYLGVKRAWCPALGDFIYFGASGFQHLIQKGRKFRTKDEQMNRFTLLYWSKSIIFDPNIAIKCDQKSKDKRVRYWIFEANREDIPITLVVLELRDGKKYFLSIYRRIQKPMD